MAQGKIIMLPTPIGPLSIQEMNSPAFIETVINTRFWVAENARTTRRFISSLQLNINISELDIFELNADFSLVELQEFLKKNIVLGDIAVTSEAGLPGMADPGSEIARWAHKNDVIVQTFSGPGSVYLALCASGLNGQQFVFHGYCPIKEDALKTFISELTIQCAKTGYTQIFIETPYRSEKVFDNLLKFLPPEMNLCVAVNLQSDQSYLKTQKISEWQKKPKRLGKSPAVFLVGRAS